MPRFVPGFNPGEAREKPLAYTNPPPKKHKARKEL